MKTLEEWILQCVIDNIDLLDIFEIETIELKEGQDFEILEDRPSFNQKLLN